MLSTTSATPGRAGTVCESHRWPADEEHRVVRHFGVLREEGGQGRIRRHVVGPRQQRRIEPQHLARPTAGTARRSRAAARAFRARSARPPATGPASAPARRGPAPAGAWAGLRASEPSSTRQQPASGPSSRVIITLYIRSRPAEVNRMWTAMFRRLLREMTLVLALFAAAGRRSRRLDADINAKIRQEENSHSQIMRTLHMLTDVYGPRVTGSPNLKAAGEWAIKQMRVVGLHERPSRAVGLRPSRLGQRALLGAHHRAGQGSADVRGAGVDAGHQRHGDRAGLPAASMPERPTPSELTAFLDGAKDKVQGPDRARRQAHDRAGEPQSAGQAASRRSGARAVRSEQSRTRGQFGRGGRGGPAAPPPPMTARRDRPPRSTSSSSRTARSVRVNDAGARARADHRVQQPHLRRDQGGADRRDAQRGLRPHLAHPRRRHAGRARVQHRQQGLPGRAARRTTRSPRFPAPTRRTRS